MTIKTALHYFQNHINILFYCLRRFIYATRKTDSTTDRPDLHVPFIVPPFSDRSSVPQKLVIHLLRQAAAIQKKMPAYNHTSILKSAAYRYNRHSRCQKRTAAVFIILSDNFYRQFLTGDGLLHRLDLGRYGLRELLMTSWAQMDAIQTVCLWNHSGRIQEVCTVFLGNLLIGCA